MADGVDHMEQYRRVRQAIADGQATVDALVGFFRERASMEDHYSRSLLKLSKTMSSISRT